MGAAARRGIASLGVRSEKKLKRGKYFLEHLSIPADLAQDVGTPWTDINYRAHKQPLTFAFIPMDIF